MDPWIQTWHAGLVRILTALRRIASNLIIGWHRRKRRQTQIIVLLLHVPPNQQTRDSFVYGPGQGSSWESSKHITKLDNVLWQLSSQGILAQTKLDIMQRAVAKCSNVSIFIKGLQISSLLDSGSEVSLICQSYLEEYLLPRIETPIVLKADAHVLFNLTVATDGQLPIENIHRIGHKFLGAEGAKCWFPNFGGT